MIGASADTLELQKKFTEKEKLNYPLLADPERKAIKAFGVLGPSGLATRASFVINKQGNIAKIYEKVAAATHPDEVLEYVKTNLAKK